MICSFCGKPREPGRTMIAGQQGAHICEACVLSSLRVLSGDPDSSISVTEIETEEEEKP